MPPWSEAAEFCKKLSARPEEASAKRVYWLPTEAEWEYACRAGSDTSYYFGNDETKLGDCAWFEANSDQRPHPAGRKKPNAWGLYDMYGNVWEWCADSFGWDYYKRSPPRDPQGPPPNPFHIRRGGSWHAPGSICRSAFRDNHNGNAYDVGFRVVCEVPTDGVSPSGRSLAP
jgi:formylglycine-generating enzyme required for sulfatase activity